MNYKELKTLMLNKHGLLGVGVMTTILDALDENGEGVVHIRSGGSRSRVATIQCTVESFTDTVGASTDSLGQSTYRVALPKPLINRPNSPTSNVPLKVSPSTAEDTTKVSSVAKGDSSQSATKASGHAVAKVTEAEYKTLKSLAVTWKANVQPGMDTACMNTAIKYLKVKVIAGVSIQDVELQVGIAMGYLAENGWINARNMANWANNGYIGMTEDQLKAKFPSRKKGKEKDLGEYTTDNPEMDMSQYPKKEPIDFQRDFTEEINKL